MSFIMNCGRCGSKRDVASCMEGPYEAIVWHSSIVSWPVVPADWGWPEDFQDAPGQTKNSSWWNACGGVWFQGEGTFPFTLLLPP